MKKKKHPEDKPNWKVECTVCGQKPTVGTTELCGPCCFGESDMLDWYLEYEKE